MNFKDHIWNMNIALEQAQKAYRDNEVPIGALVVDGDGKIISSAYNEKEHHHNPCGHAEVLALKRAGEKIENWRLIGCTLYATLEPCPMCMSAAQQARIKRVIFGAYDKKGGSISLGFNLSNNKKLNHQFEVIGGINHFECSQIISSFFKEKRSSYKFKNKLLEGD